MSLEELHAVQKRLVSVLGYTDYQVQYYLVSILIELKLLNEKMEKLNGRETA